MVINIKPIMSKPADGAFAILSNHQSLVFLRSESIFLQRRAELDECTSFSVLSFTSVIECSLLELVLLIPSLLRSTHYFTIS